ncbi:MAG: histidine phosphatase family protein [Gordonia sp. (in: high G+C Gram-positive bacteria)]
MRDGTRTLILLRHGKSGYPPGVDDHRRPLAPRGEREATLAGQWIRAEGLHVDAILCSTATRTRRTLDHTAISSPTIYLDEIYGGSPTDIFEALRIHTPADARTVLVVGHVPGLPDTALALDPGAGVEQFPTSAYAVVDIGSEWADIGLAPDPAARLRGVRIPRATDS